MSSALLLTGSDTGIGKTYVATTLLRRMKREGRRVGALKPVCSGVVPGEPSDVTRLAEACGWPAEAVCPQTFAAPISPPEAASAEGRSVDIEAIDNALRAAANRCDWLVVEGAGGVLTPLTGSHSVAEWARAHALPMMAVVDVRLGAINQAMLIAEAAERRMLPVTFVLNEFQGCDENVRVSTARTLAKELAGRVVARVARDGELMQFDPSHPEEQPDTAVDIGVLEDCFEEFE